MLSTPIQKSGSQPSLGSSHPTAGQDVMAVVTRVATSSLTELTLIAFLESRLPDFMIPRYLDFVRAIPKNPDRQDTEVPFGANKASRKSTWDRERDPV